MKICKFKNSVNSRNYKYGLKGIEKTISWLPLIMNGTSRVELYWEENSIQYNLIKHIPSRKFNTIKKKASPV